jgi:hypothetical protein
MNSSDADTFCTTTTALSGREVHETVSALGKQTAGLCSLQPHDPGGQDAANAGKARIG